MELLDRYTYTWAEVAPEGYRPSNEALLDQSIVFDNSGETWTWEGAVADPAKPVRIVLAYTDAPGAIGTSPQVNDLNLAADISQRLLLIDEGRLELKKEYNRRITYHDPCQIARNGGVMDEPRYILQHLTDDFREMTPDPKYNWCCGGGGGRGRVARALIYGFRTLPRDIGKPLLLGLVIAGCGGGGGGGGPVPPPGLPATGTINSRTQAPIKTQRVTLPASWLSR